jgi:hypothetical protein
VDEEREPGRQERAVRVALRSEEPARGHGEWDEQGEHEQGEARPAQLAEDLDVQRVAVHHAELSGPLALPLEPVGARARALQRPVCERVEGDAPVLHAPVGPELAEAVAQIGGVPDRPRLEEGLALVVEPTRGVGHDGGDGDRGQPGPGRGQEHAAARAARDAHGVDPPVGEQPERAERHRAQRGAGHPASDLAGLAGELRELRGGQPVSTVRRAHGQVDRHRRGQQGDGQPPRVRDERVGHDADGRGADAAAREGEEQRGGDDGHDARAEHARHRPLARPRSAVQREREADRAEHAERVPVGEREGQARRVATARARERRGEQARHERGGGERADHERDPAQDAVEVARPRRERAHEGQDEQVGECAVELDHGPDGGVRPARRDERPAGEQGEGAGAQRQRRAPAREGALGEGDPADEQERHDGREERRHAGEEAAGAQGERRRERRGQQQPGARRGDPQPGRAAPRPTRAGPLARSGAAIRILRGPADGLVARSIRVDRHDRGLIGGGHEVAQRSARPRCRAGPVPRVSAGGPR